MATTIVNGFSGSGCTCISGYCLATACVESSDITNFYGDVSGLLLGPACVCPDAQVAAEDPYEAIVLDSAGSGDKFLARWIDSSEGGLITCYPCGCDGCCENSGVGAIYVKIHFVGGGGPVCDTLTQNHPDDPCLWTGAGYVSLRWCDSDYSDHTTMTNLILLCLCDTGEELCATSGSCTCNTVLMEFRISGAYSC